MFWVRTGLVVMIFLLASCPGFPTPQVPVDLRTVRLFIQPPEPNDLPAGWSANRSALQLSAVRVEDGAVVMQKTFFGPPRDLLEIQSDLTERELIVGVPRDLSLNMVIQTPTAGASQLGKAIAVLVWPDGRGGQTSRIPAGTGDINLGLVSLVGVQVQGAHSEVLPIDETFNPLSLGGTLDDGGQDLTVLPDSNGFDDDDGVPDVLED